MSQLLDEKIKELVDLLEKYHVYSETRNLAENSVNTFDRMIDLLNFSIQKGWSANDLVKLAKVILALQK